MLHKEIIHQLRVDKAEAQRKIYELSRRSEEFEKKYHDLKIEYTHFCEVTVRKGYILLALLQKVDEFRFDHQHAKDKKTISLPELPRKSGENVNSTVSDAVFGQYPVLFKAP
jgi:hypothetical protein